MQDIFEFWKAAGPTDCIHPADRHVIERLCPNSHDLDFRFLPGNIWGPVKTAKVVLLFKPPGKPGEEEIENALTEAASEEWQEYEMRNRAGREPLRKGWGFKWLESRTRRLELKESDLCSKVAVLNLGAYHSRSNPYKDEWALAALPSSRASIAWAQDVLFPEAIAGKRVVICLRAAKWWGLQPGRPPKGTLFTPRHNPRGDIVGDSKEIVLAVKSAVG